MGYFWAIGTRVRFAAGSVSATEYGLATAEVVGYGLARVCVGRVFGRPDGRDVEASENDLVPILRTDPSEQTPYALVFGCPPDELEPPDPFAPPVAFFTAGVVPDGRAQPSLN